MSDTLANLTRLFADEKAFPMLSRTVRANGRPPRADAAAQARLDVIYVGCETDDATVQVICWLEAPGGGIANAFDAAIVDRQGKTISRERFLSFDTTDAMAALEVPRSIYRECSVELFTASLSAGAVVLEVDPIPLSNFRAPTKEEMRVEFHVDDPAKKPGISGQEIKVCYSVGSGEAFDYNYKQARREDQIYLAGAGSLVVPGHTFDSAEVSLWMDTGGKSPEYRGDAPVIDCAGSTLTWKFSDKWNQSMRENFPSISWAENVGYNLEFSCKMDGDEKEINKFLITNIEQKAKASYERYDLPRIRIYLDCIAEGSAVTMADGSQKLVETLCPGDSLLSDDGTAVAVKSIDGDAAEDAAGRLTLADGRELCVTQGHVAFMKEGALPAGRLKPGDEILTDTGYEPVKAITPVCDRAYRMFSVTLERPEAKFFANGFAVGDALAEQKMADRDWVRESLPPEWRTDYDSALKAGLLYGRR